MRHRNKIKILDREKAARTALLRGLATSLVLYEKINTTKAKAKTVKPLVEKYITVGKVNTLHTRRELLKFFYINNAVKKILEHLSPRYKDRHGGYLRIINLGPRKGDGAEMAQIEFV